MPREIVNLALWLVPEGAQSAWTQETHTTPPIMPEMRLEPLNVCLTDRRLNHLS